MEYTTNLPAGLISEQEIMALVTTLQKFTGRPILFEKVFSITTDDVNITTMLDALKDALQDAPATVKANGHKKTTKKQKAAAGLGPRSLKNVETGVIVSKVQLARDLAEEKIPAGVMFEDHKGQRWVVSDNAIVKEPQP